MKEENSFKIAIIDDVKDMRDLLTAVVEPFDEDPIRISTYNSAVKYFANNHGDDIDLILLDLDLDGDPGLKLFEFIKKKMKDKTPHVFCVTGESSRSVVAEAVVSGAKDYICKPIDISVVREKIEKLQKDNNHSDFHKIKTNIRATFPKIPIAVEGTITELSEIGCSFTSTLPFEVGSSVVISSGTIDGIIGKQLDLVVRIDSMKDSEEQKIYTCSFIGMQESDIKWIRSLVTKGKEIIDQS